MEETTHDPAPTPTLLQNLLALAQQTTAAHRYFANNSPEVRGGRYWTPGITQFYVGADNGLLTGRRGGGGGDGTDRVGGGMVRDGRIETAVRRQGHADGGDHQDAVEVHGDGGLQILQFYMMGGRGGVTAEQLVDSELPAERGEGDEEVIAGEGGQQDQAPAERGRGRGGARGGGRGRGRGRGGGVGSNRQRIPEPAEGTDIARPLDPVQTPAAANTTETAASTNAAADATQNPNPRKKKRGRRRRSDPEFQREERQEQQNSILPESVGREIAGKTLRSTKEPVKVSQAAAQETPAPGPRKASTRRTPAVPPWREVPKDAKGRIFPKLGSGTSSDTETTKKEEPHSIHNVKKVPTTARTTPRQERDSFHLRVDERERNEAIAHGDTGREEEAEDARGEVSTEPGDEGEDEGPEGADHAIRETSEERRRRLDEDYGAMSGWYLDGDEGDDDAEVSPKKKQKTGGGESQDEGEDGDEEDEVEEDVDQPPRKKKQDSGGGGKKPDMGKGKGKEREK